MSMKNVQSQAMNRHFYDANSMTIRQTRKGWFQEWLGCEAKTEFKWFHTSDGTQKHFATSLEDSPFCCRLWCKGCQKFDMVAKDIETDEEILTMNRPWKCPSGACKCCCYQELKFQANGQELGRLQEQCYCCLPQSIIQDAHGNDLYLIHPPSCCGGCCMDCCAKTESGNCCMKCCGCTIPFHVFKIGKEHGKNSIPDGRIVKKIKSLTTEIFTDANAFDIDFPQDSTTEEKAMIAGSAVLINEMFFEDDNWSE